MSEPRPASRPDARSVVRVKICGVRRLEDALAAVEAGADAIGLNFWRPGRRYVAPETARVIARALPPFVARVGVFADEDAETIRRAQSSASCSTGRCSSPSTSAAAKASAG